MENLDNIKEYFLKELNLDTNTDDEKYDENICLITKMPLTTNYIKLGCNHTFNYVPLFNEVCNQKIAKNKILDVTSLYVNQIKCPYCRTKFDNLLPYLPDEGVNKVNGVNHPLKYSMFLSNCKYILKSGKNKGNPCNKLCNFDYCTKHKNIIEKNVPGCQHVLLRGKNKGKLCMRKIKENNLCSAHSK